MADQIGTWKVDIQANTAPVIKDIKEVETAVRRSSTGAAQGLLALSQAVDDVQYGFRAIVNNIPQIVTMMGGGAGIAGAVGIIAVAINQLINHWDELDKAFSNTAPFEAARGAIIMLKEALEDIDKKAKKGEGGIFDQLIDVATMGDFRRAIESMVPAWDRATEAAKRHADAVKETEDATKRVVAIKDKEESERGGLFKSALERAGGGVAVAGEMANQAMAGRKFATQKEADEARQQAVDQAMRQLNRGLEGENVPMQGMPQKLRDAQIDIETEKAHKQAEATQKDIQAKEHALTEEIRKREEAAKKLRMEDLQDKRQAIQEREHAQLQALRGERSAQIIQGAKASLDLYQTASGGNREEKANKIREASRNLLKSIDEQLKKERRLVIQK